MTGSYSATPLASALSLAFSSRIISYVMVNIAMPSAIQRLFLQMKELGLSVRFD